MNNPSKLLKIGQASKVLGVSIDTLRRWEKAGKIRSIRTPGGTRLYSIEHLQQVNPNASVQTPQTISAISTEELLKKTEIETSSSVILRSVSDEGSLANASRHSSEILRYTQNDKAGLFKKSFFNKFLLGSTTLAIFTLVVTSWITLSYLTNPKDTQRFFKSNIASGLLKPFQALSEAAVTVISPHQAQELGFIPPDIAPPPILGEQIEKQHTVLGTTSASRFLEVNSDAQINGSLYVRDSINDLTLEGTPSASTINLASGNTSLTVTNSSTIDQDLSKTSSPTFSSVNAGTIALSATTNQILNNANKFSLPATSTTLIGKDTTDTLTNKSLSGSDNTFTNIPNSALTNHKVTVTAGTNLTGGGDIELGGAITISAKSSPSFSGPVLLSDGTAAAPGLAFTDDTNTGLYRIGSDKIGLITGGTATSGITIDAIGNVGIGTITPTSALYVTGTATVTGATTLSSTLGVTGATTLSSTLNVTGNTGLGSATSPASTLGISGNVAIGSGYISSVTPSNGLAVQGNVGIGATTANSKLYVNGGASIGSSYNVTAPTDGLIIQGNVGIGFTTPSYKLDVVGVSRTYDLISQDITLSGGFANTLKGFVGYNGYTNISGGLGSGGTDSILGTQRITNTGNLTNIGSIQAGETLLTSAGTFAAKVDYTPGSSPLSVAIGDLNGDGKADIVVANSSSSSNNISVFINNGDGTFASQVTYATGTLPTSVAIGDLNGDGKADIAVLNQTSKTVSVFINNGDGTFASQVTYATGTSPRTIAIGDLNGDGKADIATSNNSDNTISVLLNNGDGTLATQVTYTTGTAPIGLAIGDLNGDGKADLVASNFTDSTVSVLLNNGNGTFATKVDYTTGTGPLRTVVGDLNGDGKVDIATSNQTANSVSVLLNNGSGTFAAKADYTTGTTPRNIAIGDLNGDGKADLVTVNTGNTAASVFINNGNGTFATKVDYTTATSPFGVAIGDLNGDGKADIAVAASSLSIFLNNTTSMFYANASTGNIGIGTSANLTANKLSVFGGVGIGNSGPNGFSNSLAPFFGLAVQGNLGIGTTTANNNLSVVGGVNISNDFQNITAPTAGLFVQGNVGVGATTSANKLDVWGNARITGTLTLDGTISALGSSVFLAPDGSAASPSFSFNSDLDTGLFRPGNNTLGFTTNGSTRMSLNDTGLGIGITAPTAGLAVSTNALIGYSDGVNGPASGLAVFGNVGIGATTANSKLYVNGGASIGGNFNVTAPTNGLLVQGNVGIGYTSPQRPLMVASDINIISTNASLLGANGTQFALTGNSGTGGTEKKLVFGIDTTDNYGVIQAGNTSGTNYDLSLNPAGGNIGIGTTSPSAPLEVLGLNGNSGTANGSGLVVTGDYNFNDRPNQIMIRGTSNPNLKLNLGINTAASTPYAFMGFVQEGAAWRNLVLSDDGLGSVLGNVGIGTTNPGNKLQVSNADSTTTYTSISALMGLVNPNRTNNTGVKLSFVTIDANGTFTGAARIGAQFTSHAASAVSGDLVFETTNAGTIGERMRITSGGNVGIGATLPQAKLIVQGNVGIGYTGVNQSIPVNGLAVFGNVGIGITTANSTLSVAGNTHIGSLYQGIVAPTNGLFVDGNVGIGATTSTNKLDVWGNARIAGTLTLDSSFTLSGGQFLANNGTSSLPSYSFTNSTGIGLWSPSANTLGLTTNGSLLAGQTISGLSVSSAGNVGIGTSNPEALLSVQGDFTNNNSVGAVIRGTNSHGSYLSLIQSNIYSWGIGIEPAATRLSFTANRTGTLAGSEVVSITSVGNVGIGTTSPGTLLQVSTNDSTTTYTSTPAILGLINTSTTNNSGVKLSFQANDTNGTSAGAARIGAQVTSHTANAISGDLVFETTNAGTIGERMRITSGGNVGIGATLPQAKLIVQGNVGIGYTGIDQSIPVNGLAVFGNVGIGITTANSALTVNGGVSIGSNFNATAPTDGLIVQGNVGIGWTSPQRPLMVASDIDITSSIASLLGANGTQFAITGNSSTGTQKKLVLGIDTTDNYGVIQAGNVGVGLSLNLSLQPAGGNVGIGTTSPLGTLQVAGTQFDTGSTSGSPLSLVNDEATTNLETNPSVETNSTGWSLNTGWSRDNTRGYGGSWSLLHSGSTTSVATQDITTSANTAYTVSAWVFNALTAGQAYIDFNGISEQCTTTSTNGTSKWQRISCTFTTSASTTSVHMRLVVDQGSDPAAAGNVWFDAIQFEQKAYPTSYTDGSLGPGFAWTGTAHNSTSTRTAGFQYLNAARNFMVDSSGNLSTGGTIEANGSDSQVGLLLGNSGTSGAEYGLFSTNSSSPLGAGSFVINVAAGNYAPVTNRFIINSSGNVGIGTTGPKTTLAVVGNSTIGFGNSSVTPTGPANGLAVFGNVGIGASKPQAKLIVQGNVGIGYTGIDQSIPVNGLAVFGNVGIGITTANSTLSVAGNTHIGSLYQGIVAPADGLFVDGNVGIGATTSANKLDVWGNARVTGTLTVDGSTTLNGSQFLASNGTATAPSFSFTNSTSTGLWSPSTNALSLTTNGSATSGITVTAAGKVGIGNTNPSAALELTGNLLFTKETNRTISVANSTTDNTAGAALTISAGSATGAGLSSPGGALTLNGGAAASGANLAGGAVNINGGAGGYAGGAINLTAGTAGGGNATGGAVSITAGNGGSALGAGGSISLTAGNAEGSGTGSSTGGNITLTSGTSTGGADNVTSGNINIRTGKATNTGNSGNIILGTGLVDSGTVGDILFQTGSTLAGGFNSNGNLGIGTTAPSGLLQVQGNVGIGWTGVNPAFPGLGISVFGNVGIGTTTTSNALQVVGSTVLGFAPSAAGPTNGLAVSGNVGIGITTANSALTVNGGAAIGSSFNVVAPTNGLLVQGNVGIGFSSPTALLTLASSSDPAINIHNDTGFLKLVGGSAGSATGANIVMYGRGAAGNSVGGSLAQGTFHIGTPRADLAAELTRFEITGDATTANAYFLNSNVGIGTTTPGTTFAVVGNSTIGYGTSAVTPASPSNGLAVSGNVGIGTTTTTAKLEVSNGGINITNTTDSTAPLLNFNYSSTTAVSEAINFYSSSTLKHTVGFYTGNNDFFIDSYNAAGTKLTPLTANAGTKLFLIDPNVQDWSVGISTNVPGSKLGVAGNVGIGVSYSTKAIPVNGLAVEGNVGIGTTSPSGLFEIDRSGNPGLIYKNDGSNKMGLFVSDSLVIGNSNVEGGAGVGIDTRRYSFLTSRTWTASLVNAAAIRVDDSITAGDNLGIYTLRMNPTAWSTSASGTHALFANGYFSSPTITNNGATVTDATSLYIANAPGGTTTNPTTAMWVDAGNVKFDNGVFMALENNSNVGIGASLPQAKLSIQGNVGIGYTGLNQSIPANGLAVSGNVGIGITTANSTLSVSGGAHIGSIRQGISAPADGLFVDGNIGIGATTSSNKLDVWGNARIAGTLTLDSNFTLSGGQFLANNGTASLPSYSFTNLTNAGLWTNGDGLLLTTGGSNTKGITVTATGNVGIGTTSPLVLLHLAGSDSNTYSGSSFANGIHEVIQNTNTTNNNTSSLIFTTNDANGTTTNGAAISSIFTSHTANAVSADFAFQTKNAGTAAEVMRLTGGGNVGIGLTTANSQLSISNNVHIGSLFQGSSAPTNGLFVDGNIGIGATTSSNKLDVWGNARIAGTLTLDSNFTLSGGQFLANDGTSALPSYSFTNSTGIGLWSPSANTLGLTTNGSLLAGQTISGLSVSSAGNVGIGTSNPSNLLQIINSDSTAYTTGGGAATLGIANANTTVNNYAQLAFQTKESTGSLNGEAKIGAIFTSHTVNAASADLYFETRNSGTASEKMRITSTGNVGIGTSSPTNLLQILVNDNTTTLSSVGGTIALYNNNTTNNNMAKYVFQTNDAAGTLAAGARVGAQFTSHATNAVSAELEFETNNAGTIAERMRITAAGNLGIGISTANSTLSLAGNAHIGTIRQGIVAPTNGLFVDGNVGIGATTSSNKLDVWGNARIAGTLTLDSSFTLSGGQFLANNGTSALPSYSFTNSTSTGLYSPSANALALQTNGASTPPLTITAGGNVGIGTTSPSDLLTVSRSAANSTGGITIDNTLAGGYSGALNYKVTVTGATPTSYTAGRIEVQNTDSNGGGFIAFSTPTAGALTTLSEAMRIQNGNLGIGTASPVAELDVRDTLSSTGLHMYVGSSAGQFAILDNGNVGIGTTGPGHPLDIIGQMRTSDYAYLGGTDTTGLRLKGTDTSNTIYQNTGNLGITATSGNKIFLSLVNSPVTGLTVDTTNGNVGVGNTSPSALFQVNGNASNPFVVTSAGNVGIGFTTTSANLTVASQTVTSGKLVDINTLASNTLTTGTLLNVSSAATSLSGTAGTGSLLHLAWAPPVSTTATGDLFALSIGANGTTTGNLFNILDSGSSIFSVSETSVTTSLPTSFTAPGDVAIAYDINFTNPTASYIKSAAPLYMVAGESFNSSDLTLRTYNSGNILLDTGLAGNVGIGVSGNTNFLFTNAGNLGIGITVANPTAQLQVANNATIGYAGGTAGPTNGLAVSGNVGIGNTTTNSTLVLNQGSIGAVGASNTHILDFKSSTVFHGVTNRAETGTYGFLGEANAAGGLYVEGIVTQGTATPALEVHGGATGDTTKSGSGRGMFEFDSYLSQPTGGGSTTAGANIFAIRRNSVTRDIIDDEGRLYMFPSTFPATNTGSLLSDNGTSYLMGGNVGIGATAMNVKFAVQGNVGIGTSSGDTNATLTVVSPTIGGLPSSSATIIAVGSTDGTQTGVSIRAKGTINQAQADYGEYFPFVGAKSDYIDGDLAAFSQTGKEVVEKSSTPYQSSLAGIVTTASAFIGGDSEDTIHDSFGRPLNKIDLALVGRVPLKVVTENGPIKIGDFLTSSSIPGVAMKATKPGYVVGKALESYNQTDPTIVGRVLTFVSVGYADPGNFLAGLSLDTDGNLIAPKIKTDKLLISDKRLTINDTTNTLLSYELTPVANSTPGVGSDSLGVSAVVNVMASLKNLDQAVLNVASKQATDSANIAGIQSDIASASAQIAENKVQTLTLAQQLASAAAELASTKSKVDSLNLTPPDTLLASGSASLTTLSVGSEATISGMLTAYQATIQDNFKVFGTTTLAKTAINGDLTVDGTLSIENGSELNVIGTLFLQKNLLADKVDIFNGKVTIDNSGNILTLGTVTASEIKTNKLKIVDSHPELVSGSTASASATLAATIGTSTLPATQTKVTISTKEATSSAKVFITPTTPTDKVLSVTNIKNGVSFDVSTLTPATSDINFNWWIVGTQ